MEEREALVLAAEDRKEQDRLIRILDKSGRVERIYVSGARSGKSRLAALTAPFVYGRFELHESSTGGYSLRDVEPIECFMGLQSSLAGYAIACYLAELTLSVMHSDAEPSLLPLFLNTLHLLSENKRPHALLKGIFEWQIAVLSGYAPSLGVCSCGQISESLILSIDKGCLFCETCKEQAGGYVRLTPQVLEAVKRASSTESPFSFRLSGESLALFSTVSEMYLQYHIEAKLPTLEYYHAVEPGNF